VSVFTPERIEVIIKGRIDEKVNKINKEEKEACPA
jgi:hypothetical protein